MSGGPGGSKRSKRSWVDATARSAKPAQSSRSTPGRHEVAAIGAAIPGSSSRCRNAVPSAGVIAKLAHRLAQGDPRSGLQFRPQCKLSDSRQPVHPVSPFVYISEGARFCLTRARLSAPMSAAPSPTWCFVPPPATSTASRSRAHHPPRAAASWPASTKSDEPCSHRKQPGATPTTPTAAPSPPTP